MGREVKLEEVCSCGASFTVSHAQAVRLLREWRKVHVCHTGVTPASEQVFTEARSQVEQAPDVYRPELHIGFRADPGDDDE